MEELKSMELDLFSDEGQRLLRDVIQVVDIRNLTKSNASINELPNSEIDPSTNISEFRFGCNVCSFQCNNLVEQRDHFQSEWHLFNLRRRLKWKSAIDEKIFDQILSGENREWKVENDSSSSESSDEEEELDDRTSKPTAMLSTRGGAVFFLTKGNKVISCYRNLLTPLRSYQVDNDTLMTNLRQLHSRPVIWIILVVSGGHFAGAVFDSTNTKDAVVHKTFHRYTVRAKQGGAQSKKDAQGGKIKSAGAMLRRYNEAALCQDIRNLSTNWNDHLRRATAIFLRCSLRHRYIFYATEEPVFSKTDHRIRPIPFVTRSPTYEETKRIRSELASMDVYESYDSFVKLYREESTAKPSQEESIGSEFAPKRDAPKKSSHQRTVDIGLDTVNIKPLEKPKKFQEQRPAESDLPQDLRQRLYTACKRGDASALQQILDEKRDATDLILDYLNSSVNDKDSSAFLHLASSSGHQELIRLLLDFGCDPSRKNASNQVPFQVANGKAARNVFVQFRDDHPDRWNWNSAQIPEPVDPEIEAARKAKAGEKKKAALKVKAERMKEKKEADAKARAEEAEKQRYLQLSDREKRALAAERRWQTQATMENQNPETVVLSRCFRCGLDITGKVPFEYSENRFCSPKCVREHRSVNTQ